MKLIELKSEIEVYQTFGEFTETHEAIAAFRIQHLRASVVTNRVFLTEISDLYSLVKSFYLKVQETTLGKTKTPPKAEKSKPKLLGFLTGSTFKEIGVAEKISFLKKNGKTVSVLLTSNTGFYGGILKNLFDDFIKYISTSPGDIAIV